MSLLLLFHPQPSGAVVDDGCELTATGTNLGTQTLTAAPLCVGGQSLTLTPNDPQPL